MKLFSLKTYVFLPILLVCLLFACSCKKEVCYFDYVSELRSNVFLAETEDFSLRIHSTKKENPYAMDGIPKESSILTEVFLSVPSGDQTCILSFSVNSREFGGDMSYDNVKAEYYYSCTFDSSSAKEIPCTVQYGEKEVTLLAKSVLDESVLSPKKILNALQETEKEFFTALTDKYGFQGEIYIRLLYEDSAYYYIGVIDRNTNVSAFLINAKTGKILAKRQS